MPRLLVLGGYPTRAPRHGGQIRLNQIAEAYRSRGWSVCRASFFPANAGYLAAPRTRGDFPLLPEELRTYGGIRSRWIEDLASGPAAATPARLRALERWVGGEIDVLHLEQPWLWPVVAALRQRGVLGRFRVVYGSQNVEAPMKQDLLAQAPAAEREAIVAACRRCESEAVQGADLVVAVTGEDAAMLSGWTSAPVVVAANGVRPWAGDENRRRKWRHRLGERPVALYVASAHRPNVVGFCAAFGPSLAGLPPEPCLVLAGRAAGLIVREPWFQRWEAVNARRVRVLGELDEPDLDAVRSLAHAFVLPITGGGGSNLKTAEALYSGAQVVATPVAMRGFEQLSDLPGVAVVAPGAAFAAAVVRALDQPLPPRDDRSDARRQALCWSSTLEPLADAVSALVQGSGSP